MELKIISPQNTEVGKKKLPAQFSEPVRNDLIKRAVDAIASHDRQAYGPDPRAGMKAVAPVSKRRRKYRCCYGHGISRVPRKVMTKRGTQFNWTAALISGAVKGRRAFPPKVEKVYAQKINEKERRKAVRSALAATMDKKAVAERGHALPEKFPFLIANDFEKLVKTKEVIAALEKIGLSADLERGGKRNIRAGIGKTRGGDTRKARALCLSLAANVTCSKQQKTYLESRLLKSRT
jgi:large subunit ribosomal protein L4e